MKKFFMSVCKNQLPGTFNEKKPKQKFLGTFSYFHLKTEISKKFYVQSKQKF